VGQALREKAMRILFTVLGNSRRSNYLDGDTLRYGNGGGSGTDTSSIIAAEQLAAQGHEVVFCSDKLEPLLELGICQKRNCIQRRKESSWCNIHELSVGKC